MTEAIQACFQAKVSSFKWIAEGALQSPIFDLDIDVESSVVTELPQDGLNVSQAYERFIIMAAQLLWFRSIRRLETGVFLCSAI